MNDISYQLRGNGWGEAVLANEETDVTISITYYTNALKDLLISVAVLLEGGLNAKCIWQDEPGEHRVIFSAQGKVITIQVIASVPEVEFQRLAGEHPAILDIVVQVEGYSS